MTALILFSVFPSFSKGTTTLETNVISNPDTLNIFRALTEILKHIRLTGPLEHPPYYSVP